MVLDAQPEHVPDALDDHDPVAHAEQPMDLRDSSLA
jgi:hypothetical protein